ncbi:TonB-dependent receptor plug domain-containing protein [Lacibacter sp. MH-610]|uniref:TonB-dependent receptor plug domain-containing protein n=1 Tax=Lacibacter sp. MH-610 TaxID=3020883 RepID=UPI0038924960
MTPLFSYFLQGSLVTAIFLLFYKLLLRRDTFFKWSRWYFVVAVLSSFLLPLIDVSKLFAGTTATPPVIEYLPDLSFTTVTTAPGAWELFLSSLLYAGIAVMTIRLLMQMAALIALRKNKRISTLNTVKIVELKEQVNPFSFFNEIYVNPQLHSEAELEEIIRHEQFHIEQKHTVDILLGEVLTIVFWFNPFAWLLKNELKQNLEFLTDKLVLETGIDAKHYQYNLLKVSGLQNNIAAANHFHFLKLKNRIIMMNKKQTNPYHAVKFLLLVPVVALLLMAFTERKQLLQSFNEVVLHDTVPPPPAPPAVVTTNELKVVNIKQMDVTNKGGAKTVTITLKNGQKETFDLNKEEDVKRFEQKYGKIKEALALPNPPAPPATVQGATAPTAVVTPDPPATPDKSFAPIAIAIEDRQEVPINTKGYYLSIADDNGECVVIVKDKKKKIVEAVKLTDWDAAKSVYEKKYGAIPPVNSKVTATSPATASTSQGQGVTYATGTITYKPSTTGQPLSEKNTGQLTNALVIVDGVKQKKGFFNLNSIDPNTIESINILKNQSATAIYGDEGKDGVVMIKTKNKTVTTATGSGTKNTLSTSGVAVTITDDQPTANGKGNLKINTSGEENLLYVVDGKILSKEEINKIDPSTFESVSILKGDKATAEFGEKGKNGVVKIILKK